MNVNLEMTLIRAVGAINKFVDEENDRREVENGRKSAIFYKEVNGYWPQGLKDRE